MTILIVSIYKIILILFENNLNPIQYFILIVAWYITNKERFLFIFGDNTSVHSTLINHQFGMKQLLIARSAFLKLFLLNSCIIKKLRLAFSPLKLVIFDLVRFCAEISWFYVKTTKLMILPTKCVNFKSHLKSANPSVVCPQQLPYLTS